MSKYPKINYIGNKEKVSDWIIDNLPIKTGIVLDLFSGGASISYKLKEKGFQVISNDVLYSNFVISKAIIENSKDNLKLDIDSNDLKYYYDDEIYLKIKWLENRLYFEEEVKELSSLINLSNYFKSYDKYLFLALIRRSMIRKLPYSRMNIKWEQIIKLRDEEYSYKKYKRRRAYHNKSFLYHIKDNLVVYNTAVFDNHRVNKAYQEDVFDLLRNIEFVDLVYIDPPYPSTMNKYKDFYGAYDIIFNKEKEFIDFTDRKTFLYNIKKLLLEIRDRAKYVVISLNNKCNPSYYEIEQVIKNFVSEVKILKKDYNYKVTGKENKNTNYEVLMIIRI